MRVFSSRDECFNFKSFLWSMQLRKTTAGFEPAWKGMEENVGLKIWRIEKFEVGSFVFDNFLTSAQAKIEKISSFAFNDFSLIGHISL